MDLFKPIRSYAEDKGWDHAEWLIETFVEAHIMEVIRADDHRDSEKMLEIIRWVALLSSIDQNQNFCSEYISWHTNLQPLEVQAHLQELFGRNFLIMDDQNGSIRLNFEDMGIPILKKWLFDDFGFGRKPIQPSDTADKIVQFVMGRLLMKKPPQLDEQMILNKIICVLVDVESKLPVQPKMFEKWFCGVDYGIRGREFSPSQLMRIIGICSGSLAPSYPNEVVDLSKLIRRFPCGCEWVSPSSDKFIDHRNVSVRLAHMVFMAFTAGEKTHEQREYAFIELCLIAEFENKIPDQYKIQQRYTVGELIKKALKKHPELLSIFEKYAPLSLKK